MKGKVISKTLADFKDEYEVLFCFIQLWINNVKNKLSELKRKNEASNEKGKKI